MSRPTAAYIELERFRENIRAIKKHVGNTAVMAMVKADAYGHGLVPMGVAAQQAGADALGVATVSEGVALREGGVTLPILCVGACFESSMAPAAQNDITVTLYDAEILPDAQREAAKCGKTLNAHIKIDSGMSRLGVQNKQDLLALINALKQCPDIKVTGAFTHFATSDCRDKTFTYSQAAHFNAMLEVLEQNGYTNLVRHAACSGAILDCPDLRYDMVRPGIILYGYYPSNEVNRTIDVCPVMRLESRLTQVKRIKKGESIGYGRAYVASRDMIIGVVPIGYGDGYRRANGNGGQVLVCGRRADIVGRICMDQLMVDITDIEDATTGALVTLLGRQGSEVIDADEIAMHCGTISYEITCGISPRVPRIYCGK